MDAKFAPQQTIKFLSSPEAESCIYYSQFPGLTRLLGLLLMIDYDKLYPPLP